MRNTDLILQYLCSDVGVVSYKFLDLCNFFLCHCFARTSRTRPVINLRFPVFELSNPTSNLLRSGIKWGFWESDLSFRVGVFADRGMLPGLARTIALTTIVVQLRLNHASSDLFSLCALQIQIKVPLIE